MTAKQADVLAYLHTVPNQTATQSHLVGKFGRGVPHSLTALCRRGSVTCYRLDGDWVYRAVSLT